MKRLKPTTTLAGLLGAALLLAGCSSNQKPAALGAAAGGAGGANGGASSSSSPTPSTGASDSGSPSASSSSGAPTATVSTTSGPAPGTVVTSPLGNGNGSFQATISADPNGVAAIAAYQHFVSTVSQMSRTASFDKSLNSYADLGAFTTAETGITQMRNQNVHNQGTMSAKATVTTVNMAATPLPLVSMSVCMDQSKWVTVYTTGSKKGQTAPYPTQPPFIILVKVHKSADGQWRVTDVTPKADQKC